MSRPRRRHSLAYNFSTMQSFLRNLRFGMRVLSKSPGFTATTILTLALGIGANTAIFTVTNALLLRPFPFHDPEQLVNITVKDMNTDFGETLQRYELTRDFNQSLQSVAVWTFDNLNLTGSGAPQQVPARSAAAVGPRLYCR